MPRRRPLSKRLLLLAPLALGTGAQALPVDAHPTFPMPDGLEPTVEFWVNVFTLYSTHQVIVHDSSRPWVIHEVLDFDQTVQWTHPPVRDAVRRSRTRFGHNARAQRGLRESFAGGIARSGRYLSYVRERFARLDLPEDLAYLPHVESSFQPDARSSAACVGMWQWSHGSGRNYLTIDRAVDERLDPWASTDAAAQHLSDNFRALGTWPLAITAYNHGVAGMRRASRKFGTEQFDQIIQGYQSRTFGFASKNFYAEFLAAVHVAQNATHYFGPLPPASATPFGTIELLDFLDASTLLEDFGLKESTIQHWNPGIRPSFFESGARLPRGYQLKLPAPEHSRVAAAYEALPPHKRHREQARTSFHVVRSGESLSGIAQRHRTTVGNLTTLNQLRNPDHIYHGQKLILR